MTPMSNPDLLSVDEALQQLLAAIHFVGTETVPIEESCGRVLSNPIDSTLDLPPFSNSSMDGFAVKISDVAHASAENPVDLALVGDIPAGSFPSQVLRPGQAIRIMTGAPIPDGAEAVVPVEYTNIDRHEAGAQLPKSIRINRAVTQGDFIRWRGEDLPRGSQVLQPGLRLRPQDLGMLATLGVGMVNVYRKPRIAILSTGDELVGIQATPAQGQIRESNSYTLAAQIGSCGGDVVRMGIVPDSLQQLQQSLDAAVELDIDLLMSTAGVSVGAYDFVRTALERNGALNFWRVNMRPGKPLAFGHYRGIPFVGLPGNPVSAFVGFEVFLRPALEKLSGSRSWSREEHSASLIEAVKSDGRQSYLRGVLTRVDGVYQVKFASHQGSGNLFSLVKADVLYIIPAGVKYLPAGSMVKIWFI
jgi:molybdopterin molybdotransferase